MKTKIVLCTLGFALLLTLVSSQSIAQPLKGNLLAEYDIGDISLGNTHYSYSLDDTLYYKSKSNNFGFYLNPTIGYFITDKLAIGTFFGIYYNKYNSESMDENDVKTSDYESSSTTFSLIPFARYYFAGNEKNKFYLQAGGGIRTDLSSDNESRYFDNLGNVTGSYSTDYTKKYTTFSGSLLVGLNHFITQSVAVNMNIGYNFYNNQQSYKSISTTGSITTISKEYDYKYNSGNFSWNVGFTMCFPRKK